MRKNPIIRISGLGVIAIAVMMVITNPDRDDYLSYASSQIVSDIQQSVCRAEDLSDWLGWFGGTIGATCNSVVAGGKSLKAGEIKDFIDANTHRRNVGIFSIYTTETPIGTYKTVALFGNFFKLP